MSAHKNAGSPVDLYHDYATKQKHFKNSKGHYGLTRLYLISDYNENFTTHSSTGQWQVN